ncbi:MAG: hypothetical protein SGJ02_11415 [bacterium]|nr:hypothetical protein [bacterium]
MEILKTIDLYIKDKAMPFLLIGGHAVNSYGLRRQTGDLGLLVKRSAKTQWIELMNRLKYSVHQSDDNFAKFPSDSLTN